MEAARKVGKVLNLICAHFTFTYVKDTSGVIIVDLRLVTLTVITLICLSLLLLSLSCLTLSCLADAFAGKSRRFQYLCYNFHNPSRTAFGVYCSMMAPSTRSL
jgi:hypothetical protein